MTDKEYREQKKRVKRIIGKWFNPIGMGWWQIDMYWLRAKKEEDADCLADTTCNWQYRTAAISFYLPICATIDDSKLEEAIVHELSHILVAPIQNFNDELSRDITEHTVTTVARALIWASKNVKRG